MQILAAQLDIAWEDRSANHARVRRLLAAHPPPADALVVLPEMFATGFSMNPAATRQGEPPADEGFLAGLAREHRCGVVGGVVGDSPTSGLRNEAVAFGPAGQMLARYAKQRLFSPAGEGEVYTAGLLPALFSWGGLAVALVICYDLRFPELFRTAVRAGAEVFVVLANWPARRERHWLTLLQARAIENQAWVVAVNRWGQDPQASYSGRSVVVDPQGIVVADAGEGERVLTADLDPERVRRWRRDFPALRDMGEVTA